MNDLPTVNYPVNKHPAYHAHVYFDEASLDFASELCSSISKTFKLPVGRMIQRPVGPHPKWSCQISFKAQDFDTFIPWLDAHRNSLTILVHGVTGDDLKDHTEFAYWLGEAVPLNIDIFRA